MTGTPSATMEQKMGAQCIVKPGRRRIEPTRGVITVGDGRGFIVQGSADCRFVITAAHCLPFVPPACGFSYTEERTYKDLLGAIGANPTVWAECLFVNPVADIAVLGEPDCQSLVDQRNRYQDLVGAGEPLRVRDARQEENARLLSLEGEWCDCQVRQCGRGLWVSSASKGIWPGMSGSPIIGNDGAAIGVVASGSETSDGTELDIEGGLNPHFFDDLPVWLAWEIKASSKRSQRRSVERP